MDVRQCHRCELRFASEAELVEHLRDEHDFPAPEDEHPDPDAPPAT